MDKYRLVYPNGVVVEVEANSQQEAEDIGFAFGALMEEVPQDVKDAA